MIITPLSDLLESERELVREIDAARAELARLNAEQVERKDDLRRLRAEIARARADAKVAA